MNSDSFQSLPQTALVFLIYLLLGVVPVCGVVYGIYFLLTLPLRRRERTRMFLDVLEVGLRQGRAPEATIAGAAASRDRSLGVRFQLLSAHLEEGLRLTAALRAVPRLLPPQVVAMLETGERVGDMRAVLPACRLLLRDGVSSVRGALNYVILLAFALTPAMFIVPLVVRAKVLPAFQAVFGGMAEGQPLPAFTRLVFAGNGISTAIQLAIVTLLWLAMVAYIGGPRLQRWMHRALPGLQDRILVWFPWRRKQLQRDFSAMLAVLLDAEVPESEAVKLAAQSTQNLVMIRRGEKVRSLLASGVKLPQAITALDDARELQWRLSNALQRGTGFVNALNGWHEALDAKAFQLQQAAAQMTTTGFVLVNGLLVASFVIAVFLVFIALINGAALW